MKNIYIEKYDWLASYKDLILVCGIESTCEKVKHLGRAVYLPLSIDLKEVLKYKSEKTKGVAFAGRPGKTRLGWVPSNVDILSGLPREELLREMAQYRQIYAVGRTAIEAKALGCEILPYDRRFPDPSIWKLVDNSEAATLLQRLV